MHQLLTGAKERIQQLLEDNATTILTAGGVVGTVTTAVLAGRAGFKAGQIIMERKGELYADQFQREPQDNPVLFENIELTKMEVVQLVGVQFLPPVLTGTATVGSIILANRMSAQKAAALAAAYGLAEKQLGEYKDKVQEKLTGPKATAIRDEIQQDRVNENPPKSSQVIVIGSGEVLFYDAWSGRYFRSTVEAIRKAENAVNREIFQSNEAALRAFYDELDLPRVTMDEHLGWNIGNSLEIEISAVVTEDSEPCLAIEFVNLPIVDFRTRY
jgi:Family of unknown function (DUF6353)